MSKFVSMLSADSDSTLSKRAKNLAESAIIEVETFIQNLRKEKLQLNGKLNDLTDLAPENTYDLRPGGKNFDASKWIAELHKVRMDLALKDIELQEAQAIYDEWFAEEAAPVKKSK